MDDGLIIESKNTISAIQGVDIDHAGTFDEDLAAARECHDTSGAYRFNDYLEKKYGSHNLVNSFVYPLVYELSAMIMARCINMFRKN